MIDKNSAISLYHQLMDILIEEIKEKLKPNEKMLSERAICEKYDVSRTTVRLAFQELENRGYIYRRAGKGTFVAELLNYNKQNLMENYSFTEQMRAIGKTPKTKVLAFEMVNSYQDIAKKLGLLPGDPVYYLKRLRLADDIPMMVETSYIPAKDFAGLNEVLISRKPLYEVLREDYRVNIGIVDEEFSAGLVDAKEAKLLDIDEKSACLRLKRTTLGKNNKVIELTFSTARSDQFIYKARHSVHS